MQIACVLAPRFALRVACAREPQLLAEPVALAPLSGEDQRIGEVSPAAEAQGARAQMRSGEALSRCPSLRLVPVGFTNPTPASCRPGILVDETTEPVAAANRGLRSRMQRDHLW